MPKTTNKTMTLNEFLGSNENSVATAQPGQTMPLSDFLSQDSREKVRASFSDYLNAAGQGISKAVGSAPGLAADILRVSVDTFTGKGYEGEKLFDPTKWTDVLNPFYSITRFDRKVRNELFKDTNLDERIAAWADKQSDSNKRFIELGFPEQKTKALQFIEDLGAGSISLASAITMGMIAGPVAPGIAFGVAQKASGYKLALDKGKSYQEAQQISTLLGIAEGGLEFWGVHQIIRSGGGVLKRAIKGMATEFIQEFSQETAEGTIKNMSGIQKQEFGQVLFNGIYAGALGAILGGASAITVSSVQKYQVKKALTKAGLTESTANVKTNEIFNKAGEDVFSVAKEVLQETFETRKQKSDLIIKAASGEELKAGEKLQLEQIYDQFIEEGLIEAKEEEENVQKKAKQISLAQEENQPKNIWERADIKKKANILYQGREKQLDQRRIAIEKQMGLLEKQLLQRKEQDKPTTAIQNNLNKLSKELETIHYQIADLEDTSVERLEKEGILIGGKDLEQLRKSAFRQGEIALRKDLMAKMKAKFQEEKIRGKATKTILKQPKNPENVIDVNYQKRIDTILDRIGQKKNERKKALKSMSTDELVTLASEMAELKTKGKEVFKSRQEQRKMASEILRASLLKEVGGLPEGVFSKGTVEEQKAKKTSARQRVTLANIRPLRFIREVFGKTGEQLIYDPIDFSWTRRIASDLARKAEVKQAMKNDKISLFTLGKVLEFNGKQVQLNKILAMYIYQKDDHAYQMLRQGNNFSEYEINGFIDIAQKKYSKYLKFADDVQQIVAKRFEDLNWVMETYYNVPMERVDVYFPLHVIANNENDPDLYGDLESYHIYEQVLRKGEGFTYSSPYKNMTISRKTISDNFSSEISLNFLSDAYHAIENQEHLIAFAHLQKAFNKFINDKELQEAVKYNYSEKAWKDFNEYLNVNINPHLMFNGGNAVWVRRLRQGLAKAYLGFNVVTSLKQLPSAIAALKYTSTVQLAKSMAKIIFSKAAQERVYELDPSLRNRIITRDYKELLDTIGNLPAGYIKRGLLLASKKIDKGAFWMIMHMDKLAVLSVYDSVYQHQRLSLSEAEAMEMAHKAVLETQPQGGIKDLPTLYRSNNEYLRMLLMFTNQLNQYWNMQTSDLPMEIRNKQFGRASKGIASMMMISTMIFLASHGRLPKKPEEFVEAIFGTSLGSIPIAGNILLSISRGYTPSISPLEAVVDNFKEAASNIRNENYMQAADKSLFLVAVLLGLPYSQLSRIIKGGFELYDGSADDIRRLIWSGSMLEYKE